MFPAAGRDPQHMASPSSSSGITPGTLSYPIFICCEGPALDCAWVLFISNILKTVESIKQVLDGYDLYQSDFFSVQIVLLLRDKLRYACSWAHSLSQKTTA